ncbi:MAG: hypothetical protein HUU50_02170 [Candidatus Brocadiae bacterium]|nr:hypothetical protein [Candidatus Brocadiia bacterium]
MITVIATRRSVCAGDDCDAPHEKIFTMEDCCDLLSFTKQILQKYPLPTISGGKATWMLYTRQNPIAVIAQQWPEPKIIASDSLLQDEMKSKTTTVYFDYLGQEEI